MNAARPKVFSLAGATAPTAEPQVTPDQTASRPEAQTAPAASPATPARTSGAAAVPPAREPRRNSFTWRQTDDQQDALEQLVRSARRAAGRRVDKADVLAGLVELANEYESVGQSLFERLRKEA